jgi:beta-phosphoglucomutase
MTKTYAFLFDLNGTMIDDMAYHLDIWYDILVTQLGANLTREQVKHQMYGRNDELIIRVFGADRFSTMQIDKIAHDKEVRYQEIYRPHLELLPGLMSFMEGACAKGIKIAIGSAANSFNIDFVLDTLAIRHYFGAIVGSLDVVKSKPHPQTYLMAAERLNVRPSDCIVFEDAPKGVEAAQNAGMKAVVLTTTHPKEDFNKYNNILRFVQNYNDLKPDELLINNVGSALANTIERTSDDE